MSLIRWVRWIFTGALTLFAPTSQAAVSPTDVETVAARRIVFGHQSVGDNLLDGIADIAGSKIPIAKTADRSAVDRPGIVHSYVGENEKPMTKIAGFEKWIDSAGPKIDIAFFKFCYIDFDAAIDVDALFKEYETAMARLRQKHPQIAFIHVTTPLTTTQTGWKRWLRRLLGKSVWGERENTTRHRLNELMRNAYAPEFIFDLAKFESTGPDGQAIAFELEGARIPALDKSYTDDGSHLNVDGRKRMAEQLLQFLARVPLQPAESSRP